MLGNGQIGTKYAVATEATTRPDAIWLAKPECTNGGTLLANGGSKRQPLSKNNLVVSNGQGNVDVSVQQIDSQIFSVVMPRDIAWSGSSTAPHSFIGRRTNNPVSMPASLPITGYLVNCPTKP
ncbi:MAG: hypothetical protein U1E91_05285 [Moraxella sp.]